MAVSITFTAPGVTDVAITANNVRAATVITNFLKAKLGGDPADIDSMSDQDKAAALMNILRGYIVAIASESELSESLEAARTSHVGTDWIE